MRQKVACLYCQGLNGSANIMLGEFHFETAFRSSFPARLLYARPSLCVFANNARQVDNKEIHFA